MAPLESLRETRRNSISNLSITETNCLIVNFPRLTLSDIRSGSYDYLMQNGDLANLVHNGNAKIIKEYDNYATFSYIKRSLNTPYDVLLNCFPREGEKITHTIDELPERIREDFIDQVEKSAEVISRVATKRDEKLSKIYSVQHVGQEEIDHETDYSTTYPQTHWHIYGVSGDMLSEGLKNPNINKHTKAPSFINAFWDPTIDIAFDMAKKYFPGIKIDRSTSSINLLEKKFDGFKISNQERSYILNTIQFWKKSYREIAGCFTDFSQDVHGRYIPLLKNERSDRVEELVSSGKYQFEKNSTTILNWLSNSLQEAHPISNNKDPKIWKNFFKGIAGSYGYTYDLEKMTATLRWAPRIFTTKEKIGATDGQFYCHKDNRIMLDESERNKMFTIQKEIIRNL